MNSNRTDYLYARGKGNSGKAGIRVQDTLKFSPMVVYMEIESRDADQGFPLVILITL